MVIFLLYRVGVWCVVVIVFSIGSLEEPQRRHHRRQRARKTRNSFSYDRKSRKRSRLDRVILARRCCDLPCSTSWKGNLPRDFRKKIARSQREALTLMQNLTPVFRPLFRHKLAITVFSLGIAYVARTLINCRNLWMWHDEQKYVVWIRSTTLRSKNFDVFSITNHRNKKIPSTFSIPATEFLWHPRRKECQRIEIGGIAKTLHDNQAPSVKWLIWKIRHTDSWITQIRFECFFNYCDNNP